MARNLTGQKAYLQDSCSEESLSCHKSSTLDYQTAELRVGTLCKGRKTTLHGLYHIHIRLWCRGLMEESKDIPRHATRTSKCFFMQDSKHIQNFPRSCYGIESQHPSCSGQVESEMQELCIESYNTVRRSFYQAEDSNLIPT